MKKSFRFTLKLKSLLAFVVIMAMLIAILFQMLNSQKNNQSNVSKNIGVDYPSMVASEKLRDLVSTSQYLVTKWTLKCDPRDIKLLSEIESCQGQLFDSVKTQLFFFETKDLYDSDTRQLLYDATESVDTLIQMQEELLDNLNSTEKFADAANYSFRKYSILEGEISSCYKRAYSLTSRLANNFQKSYYARLENIDNGFKNSRTILLYGFWACVIFVIIVIIYVNYILRKLNYVKDTINEMSEGSLPNVEDVGNDEIGEIASILRKLVSNLKETSQFAIKIGEGDFESEFRPISKRDVLANSLLVMRDNLIKADKDAEQRKIENTQRNWASQGLAEFNEVLRNASDDMQVLSNRVVERLVRYLDANMGGIYILDDSNPDDKHLELTAFYAYDRLKYVKQRIEIGENLVGQCFRENETVYMTDIPKGYVHISSGLGEADPTCLVIVPLKVNGETYGIVELASFQVIEKYQVEFIEKIGETIASTIANVKININTARLLEESHQKTERLAQQESEVHKIIEDLKNKIENLEDINKHENVKYQKLHDDFENQAETSQSVIQKLNEKTEQLKNDLMSTQFIINNSAGYYELDAQGFFLSINPRLCNVIDMPFSDLESRDLRSFMTNDEDVNSFDEGLKRMADGLIYTALTKYSFNGKIVYLSETFSPIRDEYNVLLKICVVAKNLTQHIERTNSFEAQVEELKRENDMLKQKLEIAGL